MFNNIRCSLECLGQKEIQLPYDHENNVILRVTQFVEYKTLNQIELVYQNLKVKIIILIFTTYRNN